MTETPGFEEFVRANATDLLRSATLLAAGRERGEELLQDTLTHLYPQWDRVANAQSPFSYVRRAMVNRMISTSRIPRNREIVMAALPDRSDGRDPADTVARRQAVSQMLGALNERQRAAEDLGDLVVGEIVEVAQHHGCPLHSTSGSGQPWCCATSTISPTTRSPRSSAAAR
jgi:DNA-directed RNA polymerase specialized sigma24 family protein